MTSQRDQFEERLPITRTVQARGAQDTWSAPKPITAYNNVHAWVLLGDPGAGKTDAFKSLSQAEGGYYVSARDFVCLAHEPDKQALIFIDGLDEISAGETNGFPVFEQIRTKLQKLGVPKFRISCREADWRGKTDSAALQRLMVGDRFAELHLLPLNRQEQEALVKHWRTSDSVSAAAFIKEAEQRSLEGLLSNPQTLQMLVKATANGWPSGKTQTYQMACTELVQEHNEQWLANTRDTALPNDALELAAGYLCALMLLSGKGLISLQKKGSNTPSAVALPDLPINNTAPNIAICRAALHTRLFTGNGQSDFSPVHRTVAEFLAARYVVEQITPKLPVGRVLALMLGKDAGLMPALRGLHAWLAVLAVGDERRDLIKRDPLGVVLYGEVQEFTHPEKLQVLNALSQEAKRDANFRRRSWGSHALGALATADMANDFRQLLTTVDRSAAHLSLVDCVLDAIAHGQGVQALNAELEQVVRDASFWPRTRAAALKVLIAFERDTKQVTELVTTRWPVCFQLLADIHSGKVEDSEDDLLGTLLLALYPGAVPATDLWHYFKKPKADFFLYGSFHRFWHEAAKQTAPASDVRLLLDALVASGFQLSNQHDRFGTPEIIGELLVRGVTAHGLQIAEPQLHGWLSLGFGPYHQCQLRPAYKKALASWLTDNPSRYKELFEFALGQQTASAETKTHGLWAIFEQLYGAKEPDDAPEWYATLADKVDLVHVRAELLIQAFRLIEKRQGSDAALLMLEGRRACHPNDAAWIDRILHVSYPPEGTLKTSLEMNSEHRQYLRNEELEKLAFFEKAMPSFSNGAAPLGALAAIGNAYLNLFEESKAITAEARLLELLNKNQSWVELGLQGLRQCLDRTDLPTASDIIKLHAQGRRYNFSIACLAAMALRWAEQDPTDALNLPDALLEMLAAFHLTHPYNQTPDWIKHLVEHRADVVARVMSPLITEQIASKKEHVPGLYALAHDPHYRAVATLVVPHVVKLFPRKAHKNQLQSLRLLIVALMARLDETVQLAVIAERLSDKPGDVAQRVYWLFAGLQIAPTVYLEPAKRYIAHTQARTSHLIALVHEQRESDERLAVYPLDALKFMIGLLGPQCSPWSAHGLVEVTPAMELARQIESWISALAGMPEEKAQSVLITMLKRQDLKQWAHALNQAVLDQQLTRRKALFKPATATQVAATLANLKPANAADLCALTLDQLKQLASDIRHGNTNNYSHFWDEANTKARSEDSCRDLLLSRLQDRLRLLGIDAQPEGRYADAKRADIRVALEGYNIPVEIKLEGSVDLWTAIEHQLIPRYTREAASDGYGIFVVFWFGGPWQKTAKDGGTKPKTAIELQDRLQRNVPAGLQQKITVLVIDCSLPPAVKA